MTPHPTPQLERLLTHLAEAMPERVAAARAELQAILGDLADYKIDHEERWHGKSIVTISNELDAAEAEAAFWKQKFSHINDQLVDAKKRLAAANREIKGLYTDYQACVNAIGPVWEWYHRKGIRANEVIADAVYDLQSLKKAAQAPAPASEPEPTFGLGDTAAEALQFAREATGSPAQASEPGGYGTPQDRAMQAATEERKRESAPDAVDMTKFRTEAQSKLLGSGQPFKEHYVQQALVDTIVGMEEAKKVILALASTVESYRKVGCELAAAGDVARSVRTLWRLLAGEEAGK